MRRSSFRVFGILSVAASLLTPVTPVGAAIHLVPDRLPNGDIVVEVDADELRRRVDARAPVRLPVAGGLVEMRVERRDVLRPGARITYTDETGVHALDARVELYGGRAVDDPDTWAVFTLSAAGMLGTLQTAEGSFVIAPLESSGALPLRHVIGRSEAKPSRTRFACATPITGAALPAPPPGTVRTATQARLQAELAIECDYEYFAVSNEGDLERAAAYAVTLLGVIDAIYSDQIDVGVRASYLNLWTTPNDPYDQDTAPDFFEEFMVDWGSTHPEVGRHAAHLFSGRGFVGAGGIGLINVLCNEEFGYAASSIFGGYTYPTTSVTWDAFVVAHELGHNFGSYHTQSCYWQAAGWASPGALLDSCVTAEGSCYTGPTGIIPQDYGTIMSYCGTLGPLDETVRLRFHPVSATVMRGAAEQCLPQNPFDPRVTLTSSHTGFDVHLAWTASPHPGVTSYEILRSRQTLDPDPERLGTTTGTSWNDPGRIETDYYRVRAIVGSDTSGGTSAQLQVETCPFGLTSETDGGTQPLAPLRVDVNSDGIEDLVVVNHKPAGTVSVLLGQGSDGVGNGHFGAAQTFPAGTYPNGVAAGDFDDDGIVDLVVIHKTQPGTYRILRGGGSGGVGDGTFVPAFQDTVGLEPSAIAVADLNEDGILDLATTHFRSGNVAVCLGQGADGVASGTFANPVFHTVGSRPTGIVPYDFHGDGILDLAVVCFTGTARVLRGQGSSGTGNGLFVVGPTFSMGAGAQSIAVGDFDADGIADLAVPHNTDPGGIGVARGQGAGSMGDGTFAPVVIHPGDRLATTLVVADLNGDGRADLASSGYAGIALTLGRATGFESPVVVPAGTRPNGVLVGDLDEDGRVDLTYASSDGAVGVLGSSCASASSTALALEPGLPASWTTGTHVPLGWSRGSGVLAVSVELSRDGGVHWEPIARDLVSDGLPWTVTGPPTTDARLRVFDPTVPSRADTSAAFAIENAAVSVPEPRARLALEGSYPNPSSGAPTITYSLPDESPATLEIVDVAGRRVAPPVALDRRSGRNTVPFGLEAPLQPGVYWIRLRHPAGTRTARLAVVR